MTIQNSLWFRLESIATAENRSISDVIRELVGAGIEAREKQATP